MPRDDVAQNTVLNAHFKKPVSIDLLRVIDMLMEWRRQRVAVVPLGRAAVNVIPACGGIAVGRHSHRSLQDEVDVHAAVERPVGGRGVVIAHADHLLQLSFRSAKCTRLRVDEGAGTEGVHLNLLRLLG